MVFVSLTICHICGRLDYRHLMTSEPLWSKRHVAAIDTSLERVAMPSPIDFQRQFVNANRPVSIYLLLIL
jgi:hypothetical protein